jgi:hypothetical protein
MVRPEVAQGPARLHEHVLPVLELTKDFAAKAILHEVTVNHVVAYEYTLCLIKYVL